MKVPELVARCAAAAEQSDPMRAVREVVEGLKGDLQGLEQSLSYVSGVGGNARQVFYRAPNLTLLKVRFPSGRRTPPHDHGTWAMILLLSGREKNTVYRKEASGLRKAGEIMLAKLIGVEWGSRGVRGNAVVAGQCRTPMTEAMFQDPEIAKGRAGVVPMNRVALASEIADACVFLMSDRASYVNASTLTVDGGQVESKMMHTPGRNWGGKKLDYKA